MSFKYATSATLLAGFFAHAAAAALPGPPFGARQTLLRLTDSLKAMQASDGYWLGAIEADPSADVMPLILARRLGLSHPHLEQQTLERVFARQDRVTGLWSKYPGGAPSADVTGMILYGLSGAGVVDERDPRVARAWRWFRAQGDVKALSGLNRMIAVFGGLIPKGELPRMSAKILALPKQSPINVFNMGFGRSGLVPKAVWDFYREANLAGKKVAPLDPARLHSAGSEFATFTAVPPHFGDELRELLRHEPDSSRMNRLSRYVEDLIPTPEEFWAQEGIGWLLAHQQSDGTWAGALQITYFSMLALHEVQQAGLGGFDDEIARAWRGLMSWRTRIPEGPVIQQTTLGPVMDTARVLTATSLPEDSKERAVQWLLDRQILTPGDWSAVSPHQPGGWAFEFANDPYPDEDDTAMVLEALVKNPVSDPRYGGALKRGTQWLLGQQNADGGFAAWDRGNSGLLKFLIGSGIMNMPEVTDDSQVDITSRTLKALAAVRGSAYASEIGQAPIDRALARACRFVLHHRKPIGASGALKVWRGEWMVDYLYGTSEALSGLLASGCWSARDAEPYARWLASLQQSNGGWGESPESYGKKNFLPASPTLTQTEFALHALIQYEEARAAVGKIASAQLPSVRPAIERGIAYLVDRIARSRDSAHPFETEFTGVYVRGIWYGRYVILPHYEAVRVLTDYLAL